MSKKTSPQRRPTRSARTGTKPRLTRTPGPEQKSRPERPVTVGQKFRRFLPHIAIADLLVLVLVVIAAFVTVMVMAAPLSALPATIADMWMGTHLAPVVYDDVTIGMLPLLPALGIVAAIAFRVRTVVKQKVSVLDLGIILASTLAVPLVLTIIAWLMLWDAAKVYAVSPPPFFAALASTLVLHAVAFVLGLGSRVWKALAKRYGMPVSLIDGSTHAAAFLRLMAVIGLVFLLLLGAFGAGRQSDMLASYPDHGGATVAALTAITILYLPNAILAAVSTLVGGDLSFGGSQVSLFSLHLVPLPPTPLTALIPGSVNTYAPALMLVTATAAAYVWVRARPNLWEVLGGAVTVLATLLALVFLASGTLGWYGYVGPTWWLAPLLAAVWFGGCGLATYAALLVANRRGAPVDQLEPEPAPEPEPEPAPEPEPEPEKSGSTRFDKSQLESDSEEPDSKD